MFATLNRISDRLRWEFNEWRRPSLPSFLREELDHVLLDVIPWRRGEAVLDVGCGSGAYTRSLRLRGAAITGVDTSLDALRQASAGGAPVSSGSGAALPFRGGAFDTILCHRSLYLFDTPEMVCREFFRVLRPGGRVIFSGSNVRSPYARTQAMAIRLSRNRRWEFANRMSVADWANRFSAIGFRQEAIYSCSLVWPLVFRVCDTWIIPNEWMRRYARWIRRNSGIPFETSRPLRRAQDYLVVLRKPAF